MSSTIGDAQETVRPLCLKCQKNLAEKRYTGKGGFRDNCWTCNRGYSRASSRFWSVHKNDHCENPDCTSTILISGQLTVDHIDGDKSNNDPSNLMTLCHNCHALKTYENRDFLNHAYRGMVG